MDEIVKPLESAVGWELYLSRRVPDQVYYFNPVTKESRWETPSRFWQAESSGGWKMHPSRRSPDLVYYFNPVTNESRWKTPFEFWHSPEKIFEEELDKRLQLADRNSRANKPYRAVPANHPEETGDTSSTTPRVRSPKRLADRSLSAPDAKRLKVDTQTVTTVEFWKNILIFVKIKKKN